MKADRRRATYEDLCRVPEHMVAEIIDGELFVSPRPASPHAHATSGIGGALWDPFHRPPGSSGAPGGWWLLFEPELHFGEDVLVPNLAGWRRERMPVMRDVPAFELAPDWACEVVSPTTARLDRVRKMAIYAREGVVHLWLVDPLARSLEVFQLESARYALVAAHAGDDSVRAEPFEAIEVDLRRWWLEEAAATP